MQTQFYKPWMSAVLLYAGLYNILWGGAVVLFPFALFDISGIERPRYPEIWQCVGMIVGVYGVGYLVAGLNPLRYWPIILVGLLGKIFGPLGFIYALITGALPVSFSLVILFNDLIWLVPFGLILKATYDNYVQEHAQLRFQEEKALSLLREMNSSEDLVQLSQNKPVLVVFLRHFGCAFCREVIDELKLRQSEISRFQLVLVHMVDDGQASEFVSHFSDAVIISDPTQELYRAFSLGRGTPFQLFGPRVFLRGFRVLFSKGYFVGKLLGDGFQMPGSFVISKGQVIRSFRPDSIADEANLDSVLTCELT